MPWARTHGSEFAPAKYQLIHLTRKNTFDKKQQIHLPGQIISPKSTAKYLGLIIDEKLRWKEQIEGIKNKAAKSAGAIARISGSVWGGNYISLRKIYKATVLPQITYGSSVWYTPEGYKGHNRSTLGTLENIQIRAARYITGAFKATSQAALNIEAHLLPMKFTLEKLAMESTLRIATGPAYEDIIYPRQTLSKRKRTSKTRKISPLETLTRIFETRYGPVKEIETIHPYSAPPDWEPPRTSILSRDEAANQVRDIEKKGYTTIFTDRSGINRKIGSAAVSPQLGRAEAYMGKDSWHTVYSAELYGIFLALLIIVLKRTASREVYIFVDN